MDYPATTAVAAQADGRLLLGGVFYNIQGVSQARLARVDTNGKLDASFSPQVDYPIKYRVTDYIPFILVQKNGKILVGGRMNTVNGEPRTNLVQLTSEGALDNEFNPFAGTDGMVNTAAEQYDGKLLLGGNFQYMNGARRTYLARLYGYDSTPRLPKIVEQPASQVLAKGGKTKLLIIQEGPDPKYQWHFNNAPIINATNYYLIITNMDSSKAGDYIVTVRNSSGSVTSAPARITIEDPIGNALNNTQLVWQYSTGYFNIYPSWHEIESGAGWLIETNITHDSSSALRSCVLILIQTSPVGGEHTSSRLETVLPGPGKISFWWKVEGKKCTQEELFDLLSTEADIQNF
jgi:hypothetical protein